MGEDRLARRAGVAAGAHAVATELLPAAAAATRTRSTATAGSLTRRPGGEPAGRLPLRSLPPGADSRRATLLLPVAPCPPVRSTSARSKPRSDVLVFTTAPLEQDVEVTGPVDADALGRDQRAGHRFHGEAGRRLSGRLRPQPDRRHHPRPLPPGDRPPRPHARRDLRIRDRPLGDQQPLPQRPPDRSGSDEQQFPALRPQPEHRQRAGRGRRDAAGPANHLPRSRASIAVDAADRAAVARATRSSTPLRQRPSPPTRHPLGVPGPSETGERGACAGPGWRSLLPSKRGEGLGDEGCSGRGRSRRRLPLRSLPGVASTVSSGHGHNDE